VLRAEVTSSRDQPCVNFIIEREGKREEILRGQGGSVANILSVGLRMFALATLDPQKHRPFLVLDEQDCWLRPDLVPKLVKMIRDASSALGFQVLMISHHELGVFEKYAERIYRLIPRGEKGVEVQLYSPPPVAGDYEQTESGHTPSGQSNRAGKATEPATLPNGSSNRSGHASN
jgi:hypothetical protein